MRGDLSLATHALVFLDHNARKVSSTELADNICTNPARIRKVMAQLCRAGLAVSAQGAGGGYTPIESAADITLDAVARAVDEKLISSTWRSGAADKDCQIASGMAGVMDDIYETLDEDCLERLSHMRIGDIERRLLATPHDGTEERTRS